MKEMIGRPSPTFGPGAGLLRNDHFQIAYATNDVDRACALFAKRFGVKEFRRLEGPNAHGGHVRIELGWAGGLMYEIAFGEGPGTEVFSAGLPTDRFAMRLHHFGFHVPTIEAWDAILQEVERDDYEVVLRTHIPGFVRAIIVAVPELGHHLEYILPEAGGLDFFENAPSN